jgi:hypothetical protein
LITEQRQNPKMSRVQLDLLHARRLVYLGKYKDSSTRNIMHNNNTIATTPTDDLPRLASQEDLLNAVFLDAGETLLPDQPCASVGGGTEQQQSQQSEQEQEQEYFTSWKPADFVEHTKVQSAAQAMATTEGVPSVYPLSSSSTSHSSEETRAMPSPTTTTTTTAGPKSSANFCPKEADDSCTADEDGGHVSLTSCAIILLSLGLRAIRHLIHSYQNNILSMQESATPPKTSSPFRLRSESKAVANDNKASTQTDSSVSAADQQFDFYDTEEDAHHPAEDATTVIPEVATVAAAAAAEEDATIAAAEGDATIAAAEEDTTVVAGAEDDATKVAEDSMTDLEETSSSKTTSTQLQQQKTEDPDQVQLLVEEQQSKESSEKAFLQGRNSYSRTHSMLTVHTPDHRGFLGLPKTSLPGGGANAQQVGGLKQVPERRVGSNLGSNLPHTTTSRPPHSRMSSSKTREFITQAGAGAGAGATHNNQTGLLPPWTTTTRAATATTSSKEVPIAKQIAKEAVLARVLVPPPSPLPPSESWFAATTSFRKPLGSFIREKHAGFIRKSSAAHQDQIPTVTQPSNNNNNSSSSSSSNNNNNNNNSQRICSSKDLLQRRQSFRPTIHAI